MAHPNGNPSRLKIVRDFKAPKTLVFQAFSTPEVFAEWWGPAGMTLTVHKFDFSKGGTLHYKLEGNGQTMWGLFKYGTIVDPDLLEFTSSFSDEKATICKSPFPMDFPLEIFNRVSLTENDGITTLTLEGHPINATEAQLATYYSIVPNMEEGFAGTFTQLEAYLAK